VKRGQIVAVQDNKSFGTSYFYYVNENKKVQTLLPYLNNSIRGRGHDKALIWGCH